MDKTDSNNIAAFSSKASIKEEAGAWIVKIDGGNLSASDASQLQQWLSTSDYHRDYLEKLARNWDSMAVMQELAALFPINGVQGKPTIAERLREKLSNWQRPAVWSGTGLATCALVIALFLSGQPPNHFATGIGQQASYQLEDGSTINLNTNTEVEIDFSQDRRRIHLLKGEAHFDVAKNPQRPFVVYAGEGMVWAVGTAFNVRYIGSLNSNRSDPIIDVTVTEGTVKVYAQVEVAAPSLSTNPIDDTSSLSQQAQASEAQAIEAQATEALVNAGKTVQYSNHINAIAPAPDTVLEQKLAWQQGSIVFTGQTLEQALTEIARYTSKQLVIIDPAIKDIRVGGHYKTNDIDGLLATLSQGFDLNIKQTKRNTIEISARQ